MPLLVYAAMFDYELLFMPYLFLFLGSWLWFDVSLALALCSAIAACGVELVLVRCLRRDRLPPLLRRDRPPPRFIVDEYAQFRVI